MKRVSEVLPIVASQFIVVVILGVMVSWGCARALLTIAGAVAVGSVVASVNQSEAAGGPRPLWENSTAVRGGRTPPLVTPSMVVTLQAGDLRGISLNNPYSYKWSRNATTLGLDSARNIVQVDELVLLAADGAAAFTLSTGEPAWSVPLSHERWPAGRTAADAGQFFVPRGTGRMLALDARSGAVRWESAVLEACPDACRLGGAFVSGDTVYAGGAMPGTRGDSAHGAVLAAFDRVTGRLLWRADAPAAIDELTTPFAVRGATLLVGAPGGGRVGGFDRFALRWRWSRPVRYTSASPLPDLSDDALLFVTRDRQLARFDASTGLPLSRDSGASGFAPASACTPERAVVAGPGIRWFSQSTEGSIGGQVLGPREPVVAMTTRGTILIVVGARGTVAAFPCGR